MRGISVVAILVIWGVAAHGGHDGPFPVMSPDEQQGDPTNAGGALIVISPLSEAERRQLDIDFKHLEEYRRRLGIPNTLNHQGSVGGPSGVR